MTRVLFLPDYGTSVGGGHVMRCLTLAAALTRKGAECGFCVLPEAREVIRAFAGDEAQFVAEDWNAQVAVIDGYDYGVGHEQALAAQGRKVVAVDDLRRQHDCDIVLDSGPGRTPSDYPGRAQALTGLDYALIRPEFVGAPRFAQEGRVLVSLGLTDVGAITERVLVLMLQQGGWAAADVVLGPGAPSLGFVEALAARDPRISLHVNTRDMAGLQARAQFAVGAAGGSLYERSVMGVPGVTVVLAENQLNAAQFMADGRAGLMVDARQGAFDADFTAAFDLLANNAVVRRAMGGRAAGLIDGQGADRVANAILELARR